MKKNKIVVLVVAVAMCVSLLSGCANQTSEDANLYVNDGVVYNADGTVMEDYSVNEKGAVVGADGKAVISAKKITGISFATKAEMANPDALACELKAEQVARGVIDVKPAEIKAELNVEITANSTYTNNITNDSVIVELEDNGVAFFNDNGELVSSLVVKPENGKAEIVISGTSEGNCKLSIKNLKGDVIGEASIALTQEKIEEEEEEIKDHEHTIVDKVVQATCTQPGYTLHECEDPDCAYSVTDTPVVALGHNFVNGKCTRCGATDTSARPQGEGSKDDKDSSKPTHKHTYKSMVFEPTCTQSGYTIYTCNCGYSYMGNEKPALNHNYSVTSVKEPTCTEQGVTNKTCSRCGTATVETKPALGHSNGAWTTTKQPTCAPGEKTATCSRCGQTVTKQIPATGQHNWVEKVIKEPSCQWGGEKTYICSVCGADDASRHTYTDALGHDYQPWSGEICTGTDTHEVCNTCGVDFTATGEDANTHDITHAGTRTVQVPHMEMYTGTKCTRCGFLTNDPRTV